MIVQTWSFLQSDYPFLPGNTADYSEKSTHVLSENIPLQELLKKDFGSKFFVLSYSIDPSLQNQILVHTRELLFFLYKHGKCKLCDPRCEGFFWKQFDVFAAALTTRKLKPEWGTVGSLLKLQSPTSTSWGEGQHRCCQRGSSSSDVPLILLPFLRAVSPLVRLTGLKKCCFIWNLKG